jgi:hypothetical protein
MHSKRRRTRGWLMRPALALLIAAGRSRFAPCRFSANGTGSWLGLVIPPEGQESL